MTSVERVMHYSMLDQEPGYDLQRQDIESWPKNGSLFFNDVTLTYFPGGPQALKGINLVIKSGEKVGIIGRTGAGKSSIMSALFRLPQVHSGCIMINDVIIENLNVQDSRSAIGCIPQDPFLFQDSLRFNLDPQGNHQASELWTVLKEVQLKPMIELIPEGLNYTVTEGGSNFSVGQRQLICLARVLLQKKKIVVLDEATANVDFTTDRLIQDTIRYKLREQTVLAIAHRLDTVLNYDRVVVVDEGRVVESGQPKILLQRKSIFATMYAAYVSSQNSVPVFTPV